MFRICRDFLPQGNKGEKPSLGKEFAFSVLSVIKEYQNQDWIDFSRIWNMALHYQSQSITTFLTPVKECYFEPQDHLTLRYVLQVVIWMFDPYDLCPWYFLTLDLQDDFWPLEIQARTKDFFFYLNLPIFRMLFKK